MNYLLAAVFLLSIFTACQQHQAQADVAEVAPTPSPNLSNTNAPSHDRVALNVKGVYLETPYKEMLEKLGNPVKTSEVDIDGDCGIEDQKLLDYSGLKIFVSPNPQSKQLYLDSIEITSDKWLIEPGIKIGMGREEVRKKLGRQYDGRDDSNHSTYITAENNLADLYFSDGKLQEVRLWINPC